MKNKRPDIAKSAMPQYKSMDKNYEIIRKNFDKIVVNVGVGKMRSQGGFDEKVLPLIMKELSEITGQKPSPRPAKKSIAGFKTREGEVLGLKVSLREKRMADFFLRIINFVLPRVKDFRGLELSNVDQNGNLNIGIREQFVFPEISAEKSKVNFGIQITVVPNNKDRDKAIDLYRSIGVPLKKL
ncbi:MAG: 50S ribosomal protein L5 [Patescibacteria group bacterium]